MSDGDLVRQTLAGRSEAYAALVARYGGRITAICHAKVRRADVADDMAQETFLRGYRALSSLTDPDKFGAWLCGIATRACLDWLKARARSVVSFSAMGLSQEPEELLPPVVEALPALDQDEERRQLLAEVESLPEDCRQVVMLYYYQEFTYRELADMLGVSPATINARLTKARALLRARLSKAWR
jgi:RNA polymerase sigma-70 factor (ECF subfamily)